MSNSKSLFCNNGCQLSRELVSGGLLAGGLFWIVSTLFLFASEMLSGNSPTLVIGAGSVTNFVHLAAASVSNMVAGIPGYRMILALAGATMIIQSRTLSQLEAWKSALFLSGIIGAGLQLYIGIVGGASWVSGVFLTLIVVGLLLSTAWVIASPKSSPVLIDNRGVAPEVAEEPSLAKDQYDRVLRGMESNRPAPVAKTAQPMPKAEAIRKTIEEKQPELPPLPAAAASNIATFPKKHRSNSAVAATNGSPAIGGVDMEQLETEVSTPSTTQEVKAPMMTDMQLREAISNEPGSQIEDDEFVHELEKTMVIERPSFLQDLK